MVAECAYDGLTVDAAAARLGVPSPTLHGYLYKNARPDLKEAWRKGRDRRASAGLPSPKALAQKLIQARRAKSETLPADEVNKHNGKIERAQVEKSLAVSDYPNENRQKAMKRFYEAPQSENPFIAFAFQNTPTESQNSRVVELSNGKNVTISSDVIFSR